jgi:hypothetical protein
VTPRNATGAQKVFKKAERVEFKTNAGDVILTGAEGAERCDYDVRVCTDSIVLPKSLRTFSPWKEEISFGCRWVRKDALISTIKVLRE